MALNSPTSGNHNNKTRLNSYEESLSSPESAFSNRSRVSSGEDDLGEVQQAWDKNSSNHHIGKHPDWTYIAVSSEESIPIQTNSSTFKSVVSNLLPPGSNPGENDFDPSLTELNAILEGTTQVRMEFQDQSTIQVQHQNSESAVSAADQQVGHVEWTYLEPAQPTFELNPQSASIEQVGLTNNQG